MIAAVSASGVGQAPGAFSDAPPPYEIEVLLILSTKKSRLVPAPRQLAVCTDLACLPVLRETGQNGICLLSLPSGPDALPPAKQHFSTRHRGNITAAAFGPPLLASAAAENGNKRLLVTGSGDAVSAWAVTTWMEDDCSPATVTLEELTTWQLDTRCAVCSHLSFDASGTLVAACVASEVHVYDLSSNRELAVLVGHLANVNIAEFFKLDTAPGTGKQTKDVKQGDKDIWLISASEDRTFKVWDIANQACLLQSTILSPHPITSLAVLGDSGRVVLGSEDGTLRVYHFRHPSVLSAVKCEYQCLRTVDVGSIFIKAREKEERGATQGSYLLPRIVVGGRGWKGDASAMRGQQDPTSEQTTVESDISFPPLSLAYIHQACSQETNSDDSCLAREPSAAILVSSTTGIVVLDAGSFDALCTFQFRHALHVPAGPLHAGHEDSDTRQPLHVPFPSTIAVARAENSSPTYMLGVGSAFGHCFMVLLLKSVSILPSSGVEERIMEIPGVRKAVLSAISAERDGTDSLANIVKVLLQLKIRGAWVDSLYRDSICALAADGIRSIADLDKVLKPDAREGGARIPKFLMQGLTEIALRLRKERTFSDDGPSMPLTLVLPDGALAGGSPLRNFQFVQKTSGKQKSASLDMPITYRSKIVSSGYTSSPRRGLHKPTVRSSQTKAACSPKTQSARRGESHLSDYRLFVENVKRADKGLTVRCHCAAISSVQYSPGGTHVSTGSADSNARWLRVPGRSMAAPPAIRDLIGHDAAVNSVAWDSRSVSILTSSSDRTVRMWDVTNSDTVLTFSHLEGNTTRHSNGGIGGGTPFAHEIRSASFFFADRFVLLSCGKGVHMYKYTNGIVTSDDGTPKKQAGTTLLKGSAYVNRMQESIRPLRKRNKYKLVTTIAPAPDAQSVTAFGCVNHSFRSAVVAVATSNKAFTLWDVNAGRAVRTFQDAHTRPAHVAHIPDYADAAPATADLILSAAVSDCVRLWDVRVQRTVRVFDGHKNRYAPVRCAISPCGTFLATGSECPNAFVYDLRQGVVLSRLRGHTDVVVDVNWNPSRPELATAAADGKVRFFRV